MNSRIFQLAAAGLASVVLLAGCAGVTPPTNFYTLYAPATATPAPAVPATTDLVLSVGPVLIPDILRQAKIATGGAGGRFQLAEYHRWGGEVDRDLARAVAEQLAAGLGIQQVEIFPWDQSVPPTCRVQIDVLNMGGEPGQEATLAVRWVVIDPQGKIAPQVRRSDLREVTAAPGYPGWVAAQQRNVARLGQEMVELLRSRGQ